MGKFYLHIDLLSQNPKEALTFKVEEDGFFRFEDSDVLVILEGEFDKEAFKRICTTLHQKGFRMTIEALTEHATLLFWDKRNDRLFVSRDRYGLTMRYYYRDHASILIGDNLLHFKNNPHFHPRLNRSALAQFLQYGYILQPFTIFEDCYKIKTGNFLKIDLLKGELKSYEYCSRLDLPLQKKENVLEKEVIETTEKLLKEAIFKGQGGKSAGTFLSGGYDSATIATLLQHQSTTPIDTFTMGFYESSCNEAPFAKKIAQHLGTRHHELYLTHKMLSEALLEYPRIYGEPLGDKAAIATILIAKNARLYVHRLFGGEGGDEVFNASGFLARYRLIEEIPNALERISSWLLSFVIRCKKEGVDTTKYEKWQKILQNPTTHNILKYKDIIISEMQLKRLFLQPIEKLSTRFDEVDQNASSDEISKYFAINLHTYVSDNLLYKTGAATDYYGLGFQAPYLDIALNRYLFSIDFRLQRKNGISKYILKEILHQYLPKALMDRPKSGFSVPVQSFLKSEFREFLEAYLGQERISKEGVFDPVEIEALKKRFYQNEDYYSSQIVWHLLMFELWYDFWFGG